MKKAVSSYDMTARARERYAADIFHLETVAKSIENRALEGFRDIRLVQIYPFDLSNTTQARILEDWLEQNQFRYAWYPTAPTRDPLWSTVSEDYPELTIFW